MEGDQKEVVLEVMVEVVLEAMVPLLPPPMPKPNPTPDPDTPSAFFPRPLLSSDPDPTPKLSRLAILLLLKFAPPPLPLLPLLLPAVAS